MAHIKYKNKDVYFEEIGSDIPLLLLHGNTASSKMFSNIIDLSRLLINQKYPKRKVGQRGKKVV